MHPAAKGAAYLLAAALFLTVLPTVLVPAPLGPIIAACLDELQPPVVARI